MGFSVKDYQIRKKMRGVIFEKYGTPEELKVVELDTPTPSKNQVLVRVMATSLNPAENHLLTASNIIVRLSYGWFSPKQNQLGADLAGVVVGLGEAVDAFKLGDAVYGRNLVGGFADYACVDQDHIALKPETLNFEEAASIPLAGLTALQGLKKATVQSGKHFLINGASGGIGTMAVQLAKCYGAKVTGVCSQVNAILVRELGADEVINYKHTDVSKLNKSYDGILDLVGNITIPDYKRMLSYKAVGVMIGFINMKKLLAILVQLIWTSNKKRSIAIMNAETNRKDLQELTKWIDAGKVKPVIQSVYNLTDIRKAFYQLQTKRTRGKLVVRINENASDF